MRPRLLLAAAVVAVVAVAGVLWFLNRDTPDAVDLDRALADATASEDAAAADAPVATDDPEEEADDALTDATGTWRVDPDFVPFDPETGSGSWVGYRIDEELSGIGAYTAVGRSPRVEGRIVIDGARVVEAEITADLQGLVSDNANRDGRIRPLFADRPVTFTLADPVDFGSIPSDGQRVIVTADGELAIGDVTRPVTVELSADVAGRRIVVTGSTLVVLADFDVAVPSAPVVLSVSDEATVELQLYLARD